MDSQNFSNVLHNLYRSLVPNNQQDSDDVNNDIPPVEPVPPTAVVETDTQIPAVPATSTAFEDVTMSAPTATHDDEYSMPELESLSDSDSDRDANEVEMQTVRDDHGSTPIDQYNLHMSGIEVPNAPASQRGANRRARVDDDEDHERDRRHPSQRVGNSIDNSTVNSPTPPTRSNPVSPMPQQQQQHFPHPPAGPRVRAAVNFPMGFFRAVGGQDPFRLLQQQQQQRNNHDNQTNQNSVPDPNPPQQPNPNNAAGRGPPIFNGFAITLDLNGNGMPFILPRNHTQTGAGGQPGAPPHGFTAFRDFISLLGNAFLGELENEQEDPERAKRLVDGLEEVPVGLVRRLERVAGDGEDGSGGDCNCAICWDRLLDGEGEGFETQTKGEITEEASRATTSDSVITATESSSKDKQEQSSSSPSKEESAKPTYPKIVSLPCAHVFHAACLIPWFSRPRHTTCPTCRFNIDPENLTYVGRRNPPPTTPGGQPAPTHTPTVPREQPPTTSAVRPAPVIPGQPFVNSSEPTPVSIPVPRNFGALAGLTDEQIAAVARPPPPDMATEEVQGDTRQTRVQAAEEEHIQAMVEGGRGLEEPSNDTMSRTATTAPNAGATGAPNAPTVLPPLPMDATREQIQQRMRELRAVREENQRLQTVGDDRRGLAALINGVLHSIFTAGMNPPSPMGPPTAPGSDNGHEAHPSQDDAASTPAVPTTTTTTQNANPITQQPPPTPDPATTEPQEDANPNANTSTNRPTRPFDGPGFVTIGFDVFIASVPQGVQTGGIGMDIDTDMDGIDEDDGIDDEVEMAWGGFMPLDGGVPGGGPAAAAGLPNPQILNNPIFGGGGPRAAGGGQGVHFAAGAGQTIDEALASMFGQRNDLPGARPTTGGDVRLGAPSEDGVNPMLPVAGESALNGNGNTRGNPQLPSQTQDILWAMFGRRPDARGAPPIPGHPQDNIEPDVNPNLPPINVNPGDTIPSVQRLPTVVQANPFPAIPPSGIPLAMNNPSRPPIINLSAPAPAPPTQFGTLPPFGTSPQFPNLFAGFPGAFQTGARRGDPSPAAAPPPAPHPHNHSNVHMHPNSFGPGIGGARRTPREKKAWTLPPAPGPTLRQRIERKEREAGLRCYDVSCGIGPSDEEPFTALTEAAKKQLSIRIQRESDAEGEEDGEEVKVVCPHTFHPPCLVSAARVALMGAEVTIVDGDVEVACSVCRGVGNVTKGDWDEGVQALS